MNALELRIPPLIVMLGFGLAMWFAAAQVPTLAIDPPAHQALAIGLVAAGVGIDLAGVAAFRAASTTVNPMSPGATSSMVTSGIYRFSRNPMYLGFLLGLAGWAVYLSNTVVLLFLPAFVLYMNRFQIGPEERALALKFGEPFASYCRSVRRWL
jgi:protein-S-isoprenylcysteine O-methyltransferase Ste14